MKTEMLFKRPDGSKVRVTASLFPYDYTQDLKWDFDIAVCPANKRKFTNPINTDSYPFRKLSLEERREFIKAESFKFVTPEEVLEAQLDLWELIKPK